MHYKTIALELLNQHPKNHKKPRNHHSLLQTVERFARDLKMSHEAWKERLSVTMLESSSSQIAAEALEIAVMELENSLKAVSLDDSEPPSIDQLMAFIARRQIP